MKKELLVKNLGWESYREAVSYILILCSQFYYVVTIYFSSSTFFYLIHKKN